MPEQTEDRRKEKRKVLMAFMPVYDLHRRIILGYLRDLTMQGAMIIGEHILEKGTSLTIQIEFPTELEGVYAKRMTIPATVVRCIPDESPTEFQLGLEFTDISPENTRIIEALLDRYHFQHQIESEE